MLPTDVVHIIHEFHDKFDMIEKKARLHKVIRHAYNWWLNDSLSYSLHSPDEYYAKKAIFVFQQSKVFITNTRKWLKFLQYFRLCESLIKINALEVIHCECRTGLST